MWLDQVTRLKDGAGQMKTYPQQKQNLEKYKNEVSTYSSHIWYVHDTNIILQINVARDIAVQMCDVFDQKDYVGVVNVSYMAAVSTDLILILF